MSNAADRQYHNDVGPFASTTPGLGVTVLATSTVAANKQLSTYKYFYDKFLTITAGGDAVWISFSSDGTPTIDKSYAGGSTIAAGTKAENAIKLAAGASIRVKLDKRLHKYIHFQADANTPTLTIRPSSQDRKVT